MFTKDYDEALSILEEINHDRKQVTNLRYPRLVISLYYNWKECLLCKNETEKAIQILNSALTEIGDELFEELPPVDFGRIAAQTARQVITQSVRAAERERQYNDFIDKKGEILSGIVKRLEYGNVIVDLNRAESIIRKEELIPREILKTGDRIKAYCYDVIRENKGQQIFLSRAHPKFMEKLFFQEVPEIYDGIIEIKSSARDPGSRAKICVHS